MNYNKKIPAFTVSEILIVLVITAIVIGIAFSVLNLVTKQYNTMRDSYAYRSEILKLKQRLSLDFNESQTVAWKAIDDNLVIVKNNETISYEWDSGAIIRNADTILVGISDATMKREGKTVNEGDIDGLKLLCTKGGNTTSIFVSREADALSNLSMLWD